MEGSWVDLLVCCGDDPQSRVWRDLERRGDLGKDSGALNARPFATRRRLHGVPKVRHPCTVRPCGEGRCGSSPRIRVRKKRHAETCATPRHSPLSRIAKPGRKFPYALTWILVSGIASGVMSNYQNKLCGSNTTMTQVISEWYS
jgi:hypothetical protein